MQQRWGAWLPGPRRRQHSGQRRGVQRQTGCEVTLLLGSYQSQSHEMQVGNEVMYSASSMLGCLFGLHMCSW
jgi:hypothetical protein